MNESRDGIAALWTDVFFLCQAVLGFDVHWLHLYHGHSDGPYSDTCPSGCPDWLHGGLHPLSPLRPVFGELVNFFFLSLSELLLRENYQSCLTDSAHISSVLFAIFESLREAVSRGWGQWWNILLHDEILLHYASDDSGRTVDHLEPSSPFRQRWLSLWACWWRSPSWRGCWSSSSLSSGGAWDSQLCTDTFPRLWNGSSVSSAPLLSLLEWPRWESMKLVHSLWALSRVRLFSTPRTVAPHQAPRPWDSPGKNSRGGGHFLLQGIFPTQGSNPHLCVSYITVPPRKVFRVPLDNLCNPY